MVLLVLGLVFFLAVHLVPTRPDTRRRLIQRLGPNGYKAAFSVLSLIGLVLIVVGFGELQVMAGGNPQIWTPPAWTRHLASLLMLPAMVLIVAAYVPSRIRTAAKHPMLAAVKLWAFGHLLANGDLASVLLFGSFLGYAVYDRTSAKRRTMLAPSAPPAGGMLNDAVVIAAGVALYAFMLTVGHARLIGVPLIPGWH
ncbi:MAG: NnrU family protein [Hyphomicrobiaceae bacterium]|nr:NnrU family protein [Hyphomicrobiaceae bacterium]